LTAPFTLPYSKKRSEGSTEMDSNPDTLPVKDLNIASFLMASNEVKLTKVERTAGNIAYFHFQPKEKAENLVAAYWADSAPTLQPRRLFGAQRDLKDLIFSGGERT